MINKKQLTLIDADSLCYVVGSCETLTEAIVKVDDRIENIVSNTNADYISLFISKGKYFRHEIFPDYKGNRKQKPPMWMRSIKSYLEERYEANFMPRVEADDLVAYWMNRDFYFIGEIPSMRKELWNTISFNAAQVTDRPMKVTMAAIDKDLIKSTIGKHFNFTYKSTETSTIQGWFEETDKTYADNFIWLQMLMGDPGDSVVGIPKMGPVKAEKYMLEGPYTSPEGHVLAKYVSHFGITNGIYEFQKNYRLLYMLKNDEDFIREIGTLPTFPNIIKIEKHAKIIQEDVF